MNKKITCIVPAYNEQKRIGAVLEILVQSPYIQELIVVDDGSTDRTAEIVKEFASITLIENPKNLRKTQSILKAVKVASHDLIMLIDADLINLHLSNIEALAEPLIHDQAAMTISLRKNSFTIFKLLGIDFVSGERVFPKSYLNDSPELRRLSGFGLESYLNKQAINRTDTIKIIRMNNVSHTRKSEKMNWISGSWKDFTMAIEIIRFLGFWGIAKQIHQLRKLRLN